MRFIDEVVIFVKSGKGGAGSSSFHRAPFVPKGGPDGGDGGRGGDIIFVASSQLTTLEDFTLHRRISATDGKNGAGGRKSGRAGKDLILKVPAGTLIFDDESGEILGDLETDGETLTAVKGGRGGRGNVHFVTSTNRTPRRVDPGGESVELRLRLELKLLADVGLVGKPNAGKSTLLSALSDATPKIAAYPFSTLEPSLGVVKVGDYGRFVLADIPGLIEGAHKGRGLGHRFLRHIERTRLIVVLIETSEENYTEARNQLLNELHSYSESLSRLPKLFVRSKCDLTKPVTNRSRMKFDLVLSAVSGEGLGELVELIAQTLNSNP